MQEIARDALVAAAAFGAPYLVLDAAGTKFSKESSASERAEWSVRLVAIIHSVAATYGAVSWWISHGSKVNSLEDLAHGIEDARVRCLIWSLGYLLYDTVLMLWHWWSGMAKLHVSMVAHHLVVAAAFYLGLSYRFGTYYMTCLLVNEGTTPFLHLRWMLAQGKYREHTVARLNEYIFAALFLLLRVIATSLIALHLTVCMLLYIPSHGARDPPVLLMIPLPLLAYVHLGLNLYWFSLIAKAYRARSSSNEKAA